MVCYNMLMDLIERFAQNGLIHSDFNEFNLMIDNNNKIWVIDFPQMVSSNHKNAEFYFNRDVECINVLFERKFGFTCDRKLNLKDIKVVENVDIEVKASGYPQDQDIDPGNYGALVF
jgi:RIO kinase 2